MLSRSRRRRGLVALAVLVSATFTFAPTGHAQTPRSARMRAAHITAPLARSDVRELPFAASHVAVYWVGQPDASVRVAFSREGERFGRAVDAGRDEVGEQRGDGITYGAILVAHDATAVRLVSNRRLRDVTVLALADRPLEWIGSKIFPRPKPAKGARRPAITARSEWGADESLRFANGSERWTPTFARVQKLIVHHTATSNNDRNPASTVRAIYHYHAVTQRWGDIGYNFLIDEAGRIYKGRHSHSPGSDADTIDGKNASGEGVTGAHARSFNAGTVGVSMLGTFTDQDVTPAAKRALEALLAWEAKTHGIDPHGSSQYTSPTTGDQTVFANIAGHRDVGQTQCPGGAFYASLPAVRNAVAARMAA